MTGVQTCDLPISDLAQTQAPSNKTGNPQRVVETFRTVEVRAHPARKTAGGPLEIFLTCIETACKSSAGQVYFPICPNPSAFTSSRSTKRKIFVKCCRRCCGRMKLSS